MDANVPIHSTANQWKKNDPRIAGSFYDQSGYYNVDKVV
ncbi:hypothetical protein JOE23_000403 [Amphibacillus cookii]|nr:hypothetical protein [Amphibacillus cookii]